MFSFHSLRHTFATRCLENGVDVASIGQIVGTFIG
ncbi:MAG: tyrosine-type recombinase/integrase [Enterococcus raffinosus]